MSTEHNCQFKQESILNLTFRINVERGFRIQLASSVRCTTYVRFDVRALFLTSFGCHFGRQKLMQNIKAIFNFPVSASYLFHSIHFISIRCIQITIICQKFQSSRFDIRSSCSSEPTTRCRLKRSQRPIAELCTEFNSNHDYSRLKLLQSDESAR